MECNVQERLNGLFKLGSEVSSEHYIILGEESASLVLFSPAESYVYVGVVRYSSRMVDAGLP